ncbi:hypothetical protein [Segetibacter koreensis]|uniref:hypothetical protein n=1 Tax=Segetibacter koreensis TaxID=398037 RepID=UPI0012F7706F|nr:hypothetical protein [Segetibacter koreensis]
MKLSFISIFHYIIFFGLVLLLTVPKSVRDLQSSSIFEKKISLNRDQISESPVAIENTTDILHSELLFRYN